MIERGIVTKIEGRDVTVCLKPTEGCVNCAHSELCATGKTEVRVYDRKDIKPEIGETVEIEVSAGNQLASALLLLGIPLALFAAFYALSRALLPAEGEGPAALAGMLGIALGIFLGATIEKGRKRESMPCIARRVVIVEGEEIAEDIPDGYLVR